ncbi:MAG: phosphoglycerate dehydrogenase [Zetaproteobacteria bacterium]|nr:phosphoglycerate dehydrogenase [Zetaproteobacteria bacterium]
MSESILITGKLHDVAIEMFQRKFGSRVRYLPDCTAEQLREEVRAAVVLVTRSETEIDTTLLDVAPQLKVIARACVGVAGIDLEAATRRGILVLNTPGKNTNSAAELTFALLLAVMRHIPAAHSHVQQRQWQRHLYTGRELRGKKIGIVGLGNVGHRMALFCRGFEMEVFAYDPYVSARRFERYEVTPVAQLEALAASCDILTVHVPLNEETRGMVSHTILQKLPRGAVVLNAARGGVVDEQALVQLLNEQHLSAAGIDTWFQEPDLNRALSEHPAVVATPHIGASTEEAQYAIGVTVFEQVCKALEDKVVDFPVNMPNVSVIENPGMSMYASLAEKLARFAAQLAHPNPQRIRLIFQGDLGEQDCGLLELAWKKGYLTSSREGFVSFVNVEQKFTETGIEWQVKHSPSSGFYRSGISCEIRTESGEVHMLSGTVFDSRLERLTRLDQFRIEVELAGELVVVQNRDLPGVIGEIGILMAKYGINIDSFDLSRRKENDVALGIVRVDEPLSAAALQQLSALPNIEWVKCVSL